MCRSERPLIVGTEFEMGEPSPGGSRPADRFNHTHVFNMCECGVVSAQQLGRGGGDMAGREAARVQQVNMARFSGEDQATLRRVRARSRWRRRRCLQGSAACPPFPSARARPGTGIDQARLYSRPR